MSGDRTVWDVRGPVRVLRKEFAEWNRGHMTWNVYDDYGNWIERSAWFRIGTEGESHRGHIERRRLFYYE